MTGIRNDDDVTLVLSAPVDTDTLDTLGGYVGGLAARPTLLDLERVA